ncbi:MAG: hypothetical protein ABIQ32_13135 [Sphingomicrobium sp.]
MWAAPLFFLAFTATPAAREQKSETPVENRVSCGGVTDVATVERYFADLRQALAKTGPKRRFNMFVNDKFGVRSKEGDMVYFKVRDIGSVSPGYITVREWKEISRRGARSLENAGWRGCFMDLGKVWFEGSNERGFRLTMIARNLPWRKPEKGDALP